MCGTGVVSYIALSSIPAPITHLIACSLPAPIHLIYTVTFSIPCIVFAFVQAFSAVI